MGRGYHRRERGAADLRVIVSFKDEFHAYQGALAAAIRILRPSSQVMTVEPEAIGEAAKLFHPDIVIGGPLDGADVEAVPAWIDISLDPSRASRVNVKGCYSEMVNPTLDKLMSILEEVAPTP